MLIYGMTIDEQRKIAKDMGRLAAWHGQIHIAPAFKLDRDLMHHWGLGVSEQCAVMRAESAKTPLTWPDQMESGARAD